MKKPELLVTPSSVEQIVPLLESGADAVIIGEEHFGLRLAGEYKREDVQRAVRVAHEHGGKVYVAMNAIFHNENINQMYDYLRFLAKTEVDAVEFGDPAVLMAAREVAPHIPLHWNTETTATNWFTANYWRRQGAKRAVLAKEINMDAIVETKEHAEVDIEVQVHGMTAMFQSKRRLVGNYMEYQGKQLAVEDRGQERGLFLYDPERMASYPIFEDVNGTHILSPKDMCIVDELDDMIDVGVDSFKIEGLLKSDEYTREVTALYREAIDLYLHDPSAYSEKREQFLKRAESLQPDDRELDTGFFFKETVY